MAFDFLMPDDDRRDDDLRDWIKGLTAKPEPQVEARTPLMLHRPRGPLQATAEGPKVDAQPFDATTPVDSDASRQQDMATHVVATADPAKPSVGDVYARLRQKIADFDTDRGAAEGDEKRKNRGMLLGEALSGLGDAVSAAGGHHQDSSPYFQQLRQANHADTVGKVEGDRKRAIEDLQRGKADEAADLSLAHTRQGMALAQSQDDRAQASDARTATKFGEDEQQRKALLDPTSPATAMLRRMASKMDPGNDYSQANGMEITQAVPALEKIFQVQAHKDAMSLQLQARADALATKKKEAEGKPIPEPETMKIVNQVEALKAIDALEKKHADIGLTGLSPIGNSAKNRYDDAKEALAAAIASGASPSARETPALMEEFKKAFPGATTGHERAKAYFDGLRNAVKSNAKAQIAGVKSGGYRADQVTELERRANEGGLGDAPAADAKTVVATSHQKDGSKILKYSDGTYEHVMAP